jgi:lactoylglutathione lyase
MKTAICLTLASILVAFAAAVADDQKSSKPQGMTLRLELFVSDMEKSIDFYTSVLGFERLMGEPGYVPVRSGSVLIGLGPAAGLPKQHHFNPEVQRARRGLGTEIVLEVDDVQEFFQKVKASGYKSILSPLRKQSWGLTDFRIADPDGYYLRITSR